jgi:pyruvyltransferase
LFGSEGISFVPVNLKQYTTVPNAGDACSSLIVGSILGVAVRTLPKKALEVPNLVAVGSILAWADRFSVIWGSGAISADMPLSRRPAEILAVRGPLTRRRLRSMGIWCPDWYGDPGILISDIAPIPAGSKTGLGFIPHYVDTGDRFVVEARQRRAIIIDPSSPLPVYLAALARCEMIVSSSLHGIVFAHSYGIPAAWIKLSGKVVGDGFKFLDYYGSIGFNEKDIPSLTGESEMDQIVRSASLPRVEIDRTSLRHGLLLARDRVVVP